MTSLGSLPDALRLTPDMLHPAFWLQNALDATQVADVAAINHEIAQSGRIVDLGCMLADFEDPLKWIEPSPPIHSGYFHDGRRLDALTQEQIAMNCQVRPVDEKFGFSVHRSPMGSWPTEHRIFRQRQDLEFDQVQQTALHTFEPVLILGESQDVLWYVVQSCTYQGWIRKTDVAWCDAATFERYRRVSDPLAVVGRGVYVEPNPYGSDTFPRELEFGAWLARSSADSEYLGRQAPLWHYSVDIPTRKSDGELAVESRLVSRSSPVSEGFLPAHRASILNSAFALLGDRYGWGDSFNRHDCSSFIMDVYRTVGIQLPRNSRSQSHAVAKRVSLGENWALSLRSAKIGDELYMPGHVLLYLGEYHGSHYAIHAFVGYLQTPGASAVIANQVMVTPLELYLRSGEKRYGEALESVHGILP
ncbi:MAG: SH3 domain-containing protein [Sulfobacillus sp.]